jgi:hypothetical protein
MPQKRQGAEIDGFLPDFDIYQGRNFMIRELFAFQQKETPDH